MGGDRGWAVWFTGLPGCGKSRQAQMAHEALLARGEDVRYLAMDEQRKKYFPKPEYTEAEREAAYRLFAEEGAELAAKGHGVLMDGCAHRKAYRDRARGLIENFAEISVVCPLETAMEREGRRPEKLVMAGLYAKALERKKTGRQFPGLGEVVGVDVDFEYDPDAELSIDSHALSKQANHRRIMAFLDSFLSDVS